MSFTRNVNSYGPAIGPRKPYLKGILVDRELLKPVKTELLIETLCSMLVKQLERRPLINYVNGSVPAYIAVSFDSLY